MRYYRCKCGQCESWGSMPPRPCTRCEKCGSDLAESPDLHRDPRPHKMITTTVEMQTDAGTVTGELTRCVYCGQTRDEITKAGEPMETAPEPNVSMDSN